MKGQKRVRIFAGPNGSGKTTLKERIASLFNVGIFVNADEMLVKMQTSGRLDFSDYELTVDGEYLESEFSKWPIKTNRASWLFENNGITVKNPEKIDGYFVSFLADFIRNSLLGTTDRFSFETVMSHPSKVEFIQKAKDAGYKVYLYFIALPDPDLNIRRVHSRVQSGGHDVDEEKVRSRYERTMALLYDAVRLADSAYLFDNSAKAPLLFAKKENGQLRTEGDYVPSWYQTYVLDKLTKNP